MFSLTPALSRWEMENFFQLFGKAKSVSGSNGYRKNQS